MTNSDVSCNTSWAFLQTVKQCIINIAHTTPLLIKHGLLNVRDMYNEINAHAYGGKSQILNLRIKFLFIYLFMEY